MGLKLLAASCLLWLLAFPLSSQAAVDEAASADCANCHSSQDLWPDLRSAHAAGADARTPSCVSCHGASTAHKENPVEAGPDRVFTRKGSTPPAERSAACLGCHDKQSTRMLWSGSAHDAADVACSSCHSVHKRSDKALTRVTQTEVCAACHKEQRTQMQKPSHHPVPEGKMACADCHNPHGSAGPKLVKRDTVNDTCYACHAEKRGPFVHEHEPVRENCASCHNPHGSTIPAMLTARAPILCHQCHTPHVNSGVGALGGQAGVRTPAPGLPPVVNANASGKNPINFWQGRSCMNCHTQVHGSNNPSAKNPTPNLLLR